MNEPSSLDDQLKQAEIDKARAEALKLTNEAQAVTRQSRDSFWSEVIKIGGGLILGVGGAVAAYTQFEVAELKAKIANKDLSTAEAAASAASAAAQDAIAKRDAAVKERQEAEQAVKEFKASLNASYSAGEQSNTTLPEQGRLVYIQFRGSLKRMLITELRQSLKDSHFDAPGAERLEGDYGNNVKYFWASDAADADRLARSVEAFFTAKGCPIQLRVVDASGGGTAKKSPLEVWLSHSCS